MITEGFFNHICGVCPQIHRIYRFFANGIIIFSTATLHAVGLKSENPRVWGRASVLFGLPQMKYSVMLLQSQFFLFVWTLEKLLFGTVFEVFDLSESFENVSS